MLDNVTRSKKRFLRKCALIIIILLFLMVTIYSSFDRIINLFDNYFIQCRESISKLLLNYGFMIDEVVVSGNKFTNKQDILTLIDKTQPILYICPSKLVENIKSTSRWIKNVRIYKILPNILSIEIDEHKPFAIWEDSDKSSIIDSEGKIIIDDYLINNLIVISGENALSNLQFVRDLLKNETPLSKQISEFVFIGKRRWNIILNNRLTVKLPENNPDNAWNYLNLLQRNKSDFSLNNWSMIDMRIIDKIFVKK